jgi:hypothetical protein
MLVVEIFQMLRSGYARALFDQKPLDAGGSQSHDDYGRLTSQECRAHAAECRSLLFTAPSPQQIKILLDLAAHWDMTGNDIEALEWKKATRTQNLRTRAAFGETTALPKA